MTHRYLTAAEAAELRRKTPQALAMERQRNGRILYPSDELETWFEAHTVRPCDCELCHGPLPEESG